ncbi:MAG: prenyltransferase/squalene oxidase repeat-containing protein [Verrucomicrobiales bacterium]
MTRFLICLGLALCVPGAAPSRARNQESLKNETAQAVRRAVHFLEKSQDSSGAIGDRENPAITALAVLAILGDPVASKKAFPETAGKAYDFIASCAKPDGGIYVKGLANYNTALCLTGLMAHPRGDYRPLARKARSFVIGLQQDNDEPGKPDHDHDGGVGYGGSSKYSDLSNTHFALEALYYAQALDAEQPPAAGERRLNYEAAIAFVSRCQNLKSGNDQAWVSEDAKNKGGFVYEPGISKAGEERLPDGRVALRSTGSISYAGLLSLIYAKMDRNDPRVKAVLEWLQKNYALEENPGLGQQGLFYYYHSMAKALTLLNIAELTLTDGSKADWREQLGNKLLREQKPDGSWINGTGRWRESDPIYTTALAALTLIHIHNSL